MRIVYVELTRTVSSYKFPETYNFRRWRLRESRAHNFELLYNCRQAFFILSSKFSRFGVLSKIACQIMNTHEQGLTNPKTSIP